ncbi:MAG TPA: tetratricopeptide repeat protein [Verrucomicrobiae bacterium]|nr:tetratricopeptide repeat protein [Verrucomicrobiae bacterium]
MTMIARNLPSLLAAGFLALALPAAALAAGSSSSTTTGDSSADENLGLAKTAIAQFKYDKAKEYLEKVLAATPDSADALNLMGFTERKLGDPADSLTYYNKALAQNPNHLGANEYLGELYLEMKDVKKAEERLAVLQQACGGTCEEYQELKEKIEKFKVASN